ncbi:MAG: excinuclease ABC subunit B, partial [Pseudomonadota bacterium]
MSDSKKSDLPSGFEEAPQAPFEGAPLSGDISAWAEEIAAESEANPQGVREDVAKEAEKKARSGKAKAKSKKPKTRKADTVGEKRTGGGTIIGGSNDVKARVAAGLNPVAGLDVSAEDALEMASTSGVTATVQALSDLIEHGRDEMKGDIWVPHRPDRPEKDPDQKPFKVISEYEPKGDQPGAISELVGGLKSEAGSNQGGERTQ